jgi:hypothetical protein
MPSLQEIKDFLASMGQAIPPDAVINAWIAMLSVIQPCLDGAGYPPEVQSLIYLYLFGMYASVSGDRLLTGQAAPSGASQSFKYKDALQTYRSMRSMLGMLDTSGCTDSLIPAEPGASAGLWVSTGGKCC